MKRRRARLQAWLSSRVTQPVNLTYRFLGLNSDKEILEILQNQLSVNLLDTPDGPATFNDNGYFFNTEVIQSPVPDLDIEDRLEYLNYFLKRRHLRQLSANDIQNCNDREVLEKVNRSLLQNPSDRIRFSEEGNLICFGPAPTRFETHSSRPIVFGYHRLPVSQASANLFGRQATVHLVRPQTATSASHL
ncbi:hypothetical protein QAD02_006255 [Eretmocerus hayati]|uniref:Uncharacterized protein n=1 Tax=Eretmocerus hayati TaxID=131215 RepID=A0ACC2N1H0_9HYME|nr:hypothetical protein QAD02_006255 [Eretmocerus hayati]